MWPGFWELQHSQQWPPILPTLIPTTAAPRRAKFAWLDSCGRELAYLTVQQLQADRQALLGFARALGQGILTPVQQQPPPQQQEQMQLVGGAAAAPAPASVAAMAGTPAGAGREGHLSSSLMARPSSPPTDRAVVGTSPTLVPREQQQQEHQQQQEPSVSLTLAGGMGSLGMPPPLELEGAASFNNLESLLAGAAPAGHQHNSMF